MANRRVQPEVQAIFDKYNQRPGVGRRLSRTDALSLLGTEFGYNSNDSQHLFTHFDKDKNGALSLWEFQHFYNIAGKNSEEILAKFKELDIESRGYLTLAEFETVIRSATDRSGEPLDEKGVEMFIKSAGTDGRVSLGEFADLLARIKMFRKA